jgi:hypothetical protein
MGSAMAHTMATRKKPMEAFGKPNIVLDDRRLAVLFPSAVEVVTGLAAQQGELASSHVKFLPPKKHLDK